MVVTRGMIAKNKANVDSRIDDLDASFQTNVKDADKLAKAISADVGTNAADIKALKESAETAAAFIKANKGDGAGTTHFGTIQAHNFDIMEKLPEAFDKIGYVFGNINIGYNDVLKVIQGFDLLTRVEGRLELHDHTPGLTKIGPAFKKLEMIAGEELKIDGNFYLTEIDAFDSLRYIGGNFHMRNNHRLTKLPEFKKLEYIQLNFRVQDNGKEDGGLKEAGGWPELVTIGEGFTVTDNCTLLIMITERFIAWY